MSLFQTNEHKRRTYPTDDVHKVGEKSGDLRVGLKIQQGNLRRESMSEHTACDTHIHHLSAS